MKNIKAYEEVVNFIATGTTPQNVIAFRPLVRLNSVFRICCREKEGELSSVEKSELDDFSLHEHSMRLAKDARDFLPND